ncbi:MAG TPA: hypothetical protein DCY42_06660, partial [Chloroflexi bacterium]|nr:hypothetical protein [Chloroflexota bacterium]
MDLDLEADLGIDTVKQAELFAAVRQHFGIPRREDLMLVDYNTLQKVVGFVQESFPDGQEAQQAVQQAPEPAPLPAAPVQRAAAAPEPQSQSRPTEEEIVSFVLNLVS